MTVIGQTNRLTALYTLWIREVINSSKCWPIFIVFFHWYTLWQISSKEGLNIGFLFDRPYIINKSYFIYNCATCVQSTTLRKLLLISACSWSHLLGEISKNASFESSSTARLYKTTTDRQWLRHLSLSGQQILWMREAKRVKGRGVWRSVVSPPLRSDSEVWRVARAILCNSVRHCCSLLKISYMYIN